MASAAVILSEAERATIVAAIKAVEGVACLFTPSGLKRVFNPETAPSELIQVRSRSISIRIGISRGATSRDVAGAVGQVIATQLAQLRPGVDTPTITVTIADLHR